MVRRRHVAAPRRLIVIAGNRATNAEHEAGRLTSDGSHRATAQVTLTWPNTLPEGSAADRTPSDCVRRLTHYGPIPDAWPVAKPTETQ
jgi:hypothetical protein